MAAALRRENKPAAIDAAMKRFDADPAETEEGNEGDFDTAAIEKEREAIESYLKFIDDLLLAERNSGSKDSKSNVSAISSDNREFLQRYQMEKLIKRGGPFGGTFGNGYTPREFDAILAKTLAWEGPEMEKTVVCTGAVGFIATVNEEGELDKTDIFECIKQGFDEDKNRCDFVEGQILTADGLRVKDLRIVDVLGNKKYKLSSSLLLNSKDAPGVNYCGKTPPVLVKRYNVLSFRAAKMAFDEEKKMGGVKAQNALQPKDQILGLSTEQAFEFRIAFDIIAEEYQPGITNDPDNVAIPEDRISDVFLALGYTMMDYDLEFIVGNAFPNSEGLYTCADLIESFDQWKQKQLHYESLKSVFNTLVSTQKLPDSFERTKVYSNKVPGDAHLPSEALKNALNNALHLEGESKLKLHEIKGVEDEISSNAKNHITIKDFVEIFRT